MSEGFVWALTLFTGVLVVCNFRMLGKIDRLAKSEGEGNFDINGKTALDGVRDQVNDLRRAVEAMRSSSSPKLADGPISFLASITPSDAVNGTYWIHSGDVDVDTQLRNCAYRTVKLTLEQPPEAQEKQ